MPRQYQGTIDAVTVFCEINKKNAGNGVYASADFDIGGGQSFDKAARCSANGQEPASHLMVHHPVDSAFLTGVEDALAVVPWAGIYKESLGDDWQAALADMGLQLIGE